MGTAGPVSRTAVSSTMCEEWQANQGRNGRGPQRRQPSRADIEFERVLFARHGRLRRRNRKRRSILLVGGAARWPRSSRSGSPPSPSPASRSCSRSATPRISARSRSARTRSSTRTTASCSASSRRRRTASRCRSRRSRPSLPQATVAIEDARFWQHGALDYQGILRALYQDPCTGQIVQGGSTITQELVQNLYIGNAQRTVARKIKEACLATKFFEQNTRKKILADYLNEVFYGRHAYGAQAASTDVLLEARLEADARAGGAPRRTAAGTDACSTRSPIRTPRASGGTRCCTRCAGTATSPQSKLRQRDGEGARAQAGPPLHAPAPAELLRLGDAAARPAPRQARPAAGGARRPITSRRRSTSACRASRPTPSARSCRPRPIPPRRSSRSTRRPAPSRRWSTTSRAAARCSSTSRPRPSGRRAAPSSRSRSRPR